MKEFYSQFMNKSDLVFDIGANVGNRTRVFAELADKVVAVEPQYGCCESLRNEFIGNPKVYIVNKGCGAQEGTGNIHFCNTISSLSVPWMQAVEKSGRFAGHVWSAPSPITLTTLDKLIREYGYPTFIKIDVEGYELEVLKGLTIAPDYLSFEFTPERLCDTYDCIERLNDIGMQYFNYSLGESMELKWGRGSGFATKEVLIKHLENYTDNITFGDVYAAKRSNW